MSINLMIIDDSGAVRSALEQLIAGEEDITLQASVSNPYDAAGEIKKKIPDVIILDIEMPKMDGITFLKKIMSQKPIPTIICSTLTVDGSPKYLEALRAGAIDVIEKPRISTKKEFAKSQYDLIGKIRTAAESRVGPKPRKLSSQKKKASGEQMNVEPKRSPDELLPRTRYRAHLEMPPIIAMGASTGGTVALEAVLTELPMTMPPIVIVQHMPGHFTKAFAKRLDGLCKMRVKEAEAKERVLPGTVYIAPGNLHMAVRKMGQGYQIDLIDGPTITRHKPSVDVLFRSVATCAGPNAMGVMLTGMGDDGAIGMKEMKEEGAYNISQDEKTCVVYGMPREAVLAGAVDLELPLNKVVTELISRYT